MSDIFQKVRKLTHNGEAAPAFQEIQRICRLPVVGELAPEEVEEYSRQVVLAEAFDAGWRLKPSQVAAVSSYELFGGGFFPIGVGRGKTLVSLMVAERAYQDGITKSMLLVPPQVYPQLVLNDIPFYRRKVNLSVRFIGMGDCSPKARRRAAASRIPACHIVPYSTLSTRDADEMLEAICPQLIIADEAHNLKNAGVARTKRIRRFMEAHSPRLVAMSGTITNKSILDYWHLIRAALGVNCPLPLIIHLVNSWAGLLDSDASYTDAGQSGPILPLVRWARHNFPDEDIEDSVRGFRRAYKLRLITAPGVVASGNADIDVSLILSNVQIEHPEKSPGWDVLQGHVTRLRDEWLTPVGDEIEHAIHAFKWHYELTAGFYNELFWQTPDQLAKQKRISEVEAAERLERAQHHHELQQEYHRKLRRWLDRNARPGLDTPFLVGSDMHSHGARNVGQELYDVWRVAKDAEFPDMPERQSRPVRICPYKIDAAVRWVNDLPKGKGAILWVMNQEIGEWLTEALRTAGYDPLHCPAGSESNVAITKVGDPNGGGKGDRIVVASVGAHGTGKNLQAFEHQLAVQWPRSAVVAEQMIGRLHREGQQADEITVHRLDTTWFDRVVFAACLNDACYIHDTSTRQKLMYAAYEHSPTIFDQKVLQAQGLEAQRLTGEQVKLLEDKFGVPSQDVR